MRRRVAYAFAVFGRDLMGTPWRKGDREEVLEEGFLELANQVERVRVREDATAAAVVVICDSRVVLERYTGFHPQLGVGAGDERNRAVDSESRFNVYSGRKAYIGLATALAVWEGFIGSLDDPASRYVEDLSPKVLAGTTVRHLLTHTHGLDRDAGGRLYRRFDAGTRWHYTNAGIDVLTQALERVTGKTVADVLAERVFAPIGFTQTRFEQAESPAMVADVREPFTPSRVPGTAAKGVADYTLGPPDGTDRNLYVSAREYALWGGLHLAKGGFDGRQVLPEAVFELATGVQSPRGLPAHLPRQGFFWWVKERDSPVIELGREVPVGAYQIVGMGGSVCLVIPDYKTVAVRLYNSLTRRPSFVRHVRAFGDTVMACLESCR